MNNNPDISRHFQWSEAAFTDVGKVRKINEDSMMSRSDLAHWVVADGMGGHDDGSVASQAVTDSLVKLDRAEEFTHFIDDIEDSIIDVNRHLRELAGDDENKVIGTTVVGMTIENKHVVYYWVGDSRIYRLRDGELEQLSVDHTFLQELVQEGKLSADEVSAHPEKNVITRAVGADDEVFVDFEIDEIRHGDLYLLCSDGVEKELTDDEVKDIMLKHGSDVETMGKEMLDIVLERGSPDNVTLILVEMSRTGGS